MIINSKKLQKFEKEFIRSEKQNLAQKYRILNGMYKEAVHLGVFPMKDPLEGLGADIKIAKVLNSV